ncbi:MAG UNVERIFIED_CONTAM: hypothetical protein LVT10_07655 [Anaerolineae bacterium]|jgi:hypothetical protein
MLSKYFTLTRNGTWDGSSESAQGWDVWWHLASISSTIYRQVGFDGIFSSYTLAHFRSPMGIGLAQRVLLQACAGAFVLGLSLLPLGNQPA